MPVVRPAGIECEKWEPQSVGSKRCRYYIEPGELESEALCKLPDESLCVEWVRRNGTAAQKEQLLAIRPKPVVVARPRDPSDPHDPPPLELQPQAAPVRPPAVVRTPQGEVRLAPPKPFEPAKEVDPHSIEALERAGVEVELSAPHLDGGVTLVPARTGRTDRSEITFREAAAIRLIVDAFPGAYVVAYRSKSTDAEARVDPAVSGPSAEDGAWVRALANTCPGCGGKAVPIRMPDGRVVGSTPGPGPDGRCTACGAVKGEDPLS